MRNFTLLFCLMLCFVACQPETADSSETNGEQQGDTIEPTSTTQQKSISAYDLSSFTCMIDGEKWKPSLAFARVHYSANNDIDSVQIKAIRTEDNSEMTISIFMFNGAGTYELTNDEETGQGIGMAEFKVEEEMKMKNFFSIGGKVTISNFNDTNGTLAGTIDGIDFFSKGNGMMPDERSVTGVFSGERIEQ